MDRNTQTILQKLVNQWDEVKATLEKMRGSSIVEPADGYALFAPTGKKFDNAVEFELSPVVFNLPERADDIRVELYIVVRGRLIVEFDESKKFLITRGFQTEAAYFRSTKTGLDHVYGAHYDFAVDELGHPSFHAQMKSFSDFSEYISKYFGDFNEVEDRVAGILKTVRLPTAQMDFFSFFLQIFADHLLHKESGPEEKLAFNILLENNSFLRGAAHQIARLTSEAASVCYRASHWYPII